MSHLLTVADEISSHARLQPRKVGTRDSKRTLGFADWDDRADRVASEAPDGEVGELFSRTCSVGDMARRDADGYIHLVDRKSNMIISGGENIYPSQVEGVLAEMPRTASGKIVHRTLRERVAASAGT